MSRLGDRHTLSNVLFLTGVWRYTVLQAGLALTVGPVVAVAVAGPTSRLAQRIGLRPVLVAGGLFWGGAVMWFVERVGTTPDFVGQWLPGMVLLGIGAGTLFPNLTGTAVASAPGRELRDGDGDEFCRAPDWSRAGRRVRRRYHRDASPALSLALNRSLGGQLQDTRAPAPPARPRPTTVALIALDAKIPLPRLAARLGAALEAHLSVAVLSSAEGPAPAGPGEPATLYGPLLDRAEAGHDLVLLVGSPQPA